MYIYIYIIIAHKTLHLQIPISKFNPALSSHLNGYRNY